MSTPDFTNTAHVVLKALNDSSLFGMNTVTGLELVTIALTEAYTQGYNVGSNVSASSFTPPESKL